MTGRARGRARGRGVSEEHHPVGVQPSQSQPPAGGRGRSRGVVPHQIGPSQPPVQSNVATAPKPPPTEEIVKSKLHEEQPRKEDRDRRGFGSMGNTCCGKADDEQPLVVDSQKSNNSLCNSTITNMSAANCLDHEGIKLRDELIPKLCDKISLKIGIDWRKFGRYLGFNDYELDHISCNKPTDYEKAISVLNVWKQKTGHTTWKPLKEVLVELQRNDIVEEIEALQETLKSPDRKRIVGKFQDGCSFKLDLLTENEQLTKVEYKLKDAESQWEVIRKDYHKSFSYYITKHEDKVLFVKVENFRVYCEADIKFSFEDSKAKSQRSDCFEVLINEICSYEIPSICNQLKVVVPDPCFSNQFSWIDQNPPMPEYLDWRDRVSSESKISKEKPIQEFAMEYFERNFVDLSQVICFPSTIDEQMDAICIPRLFTELFKEELTEGIRAVLFNYDLYHHATLLNFKPPEHIKESIANRVVIFYSKINLIFIVRTALSSDCINQESKNCSADVKYFASINKLVIEKKALTVLGVVACCSVKRKDLKEELSFQFSSKFKLYNLLFICQDELKTYKTLYSWWRKEFYEYCFKKKSQTKDEELFKKVIGLTMLIIAKCDENSPTLDSDPFKQINSLVLNPEQLNAINDKELKKIITAGFGFGKSIVGKQIVKRIYEKSLKKSTLYYICCDHFTLFEYEMKKFTDRLKKGSLSNVEIFCENLLELWQRMCENENMHENEDISLPQLLEYYSKNSSTEVHFVLDELPGEYIREEDASKLKKLFSSSLKESLVVFLPKSIEKNRYLYKEGEKQIFESTCFNGEKIGMKSITLDKSMRVTKSIKSLIDSAQDTIIKSNTILSENSNIDDSHSSMETQQNSTQNFIITKNNSAQQETAFMTQQEYLSRVQQEDDATTVKGYHDYDLDQGAKIVSNRQNAVGSKNYIETEFLFKPGVSGHSIKGKKPKIIFLPSLIWTEVSSAKVLSVVLEKICFDVRGTTVICNSMDEVKLIAYAIDIIEGYEAVVYSPHLRKVTPTIKEKRLVIDKIKIKLNVLVADSRAMCGAESEVVIALVKPEEYYLRHVIADVCSRCNSHLVVFVLPSEKADFQKGGTIQEVLDNWSEDIVEKIQVKISNDENQLWSCKDCFRYINDECKDFKDRGVKKENFNKYIENDRFKINHESDLVYERMVSDTFNKSKSMEKGVKQDAEEQKDEARLATLHDYSATDENEEKFFVLKDQPKMSNNLDDSELLLKLGENVGKDWQWLGRYLSVKNQELDAIDADYIELKEKGYRMLCEWKNQQKSPTLDDLARAIYMINRLDLIRVMEKFSNKSLERENPLIPPIEEKARIKQSDELTPIICDEISYKITTGWQTLGRFLGLNENELAHIDNDKPNTYEKAAQVLNKWKEKKVYATWKQLKPVLENLKRKDIILEIERDHPSLCIVNLQTQARTAEQPLSMSYGGTRDTDILDLSNSMSDFNINATADIKKETNEQKEKKKNEERNPDTNADKQHFRRKMLESPLKEFTIGRTELFELLDQGNDLSPVKGICYALNLSDSDRISIEFAKAGGGNPANVWLENLKVNHGDIKIQEFLNALESSGVTLPNYPKDIKFVSELSYLFIKKLSELLIHDDAWVKVAEKFDFKDIKIDKFARSRRHPNVYSPASRLFHVIDQRYPDLTVEMFMNFLKQRNLMNAFNHMDTHIDIWAKKKVSENFN